MTFRNKTLADKGKIHARVRSESEREDVGGGSKVISKSVISFFGLEGHIVPVSELITGTLITDYFRATPRKRIHIPPVPSRSIEHEIEVGDAARVGVANV
jgi:hypothetical protein